MTPGLNRTARFARVSHRAAVAPLFRQSDPLQRLDDMLDFVSDQFDGVSG
jgi:hypothetical protein